MNWRTVRTLAAKDLKEVRQNRSAWIPAIVVPLLFVVVLPLAIIVAPSAAGLPGEVLLPRQGPAGMPNPLPPALMAEVAGLDDMQAWVVLMAGYLLAPFFLVVPLMFASIVGADSFVGEKERKTLEALLYTPASDRELLVGKVLASVTPAVALAWLCFLAYGLVVNVASGPIMGRVWFPPPAWWPLMLWVAPAVATLGMAATVLISARVSTFMEAYQLSGSLVVLVVGLVLGQVAGLLLLNVETTLALGLALWLVDAALLWFGVRTFTRSELIARI
ncbi:MAG: ABC transporter permease subunit [Chloroflexi bacterium]|nr:ABC transporter permease subunit [Chloroflexota bacterium]